MWALVCLVFCGDFWWGFVCLVGFVCMCLNCDRKLHCLLEGRRAKLYQETYLINAAALCNSGFHLQNQMLSNTSSTVCFSCFCQCRGRDDSTFICLWPVKHWLPRKQNTFPKVLLILLWALILLNMGNINENNEKNASCSFRKHIFSVVTSLQRQLGESSSSKSCSTASCANHLVVVVARKWGEPSPAAPACLRGFWDCHTHLCTSRQ